MSSSAEVRTTPPQAAPSGAPELVKGLGLTSATTLVMGSMIGSGIFIVSAEIAREVNSPALLIGAWLVTGFMTIVGALSYGELAAMMPSAGGQYVYLRESLGPLWGFLYGWTLFLVIQTGTVAAVGVAFGKFMGHFFPSIAADNWILHIAHVPPIHVGPMVLGNMDVGLNTQNLCGIVIVVFLTVLNIFGLKLGAAVQNLFTIAKVSALAGLVVAGIFVARNAQAIAANFGNFWRFDSPHSATGTAAGPFVGVLTILAVAQVGSLFSADAWNNVTFTAGEVKNPKRNLPLSLAMGTGVVILLYIAANFIYLMHLPFDGNPERRGRGCPRHQVRNFRARGHGGVAADVRRLRRGADGHRHPDFHLRLLQRPHPLRRSRLLRHGQRRAVLQVHRQGPSQVSHAQECADRAGHMDLRALPLRAPTGSFWTTSFLPCWSSIY